MSYPHEFMPNSYSRTLQELVVETSVWTAFWKIWTSPYGAAFVVVLHIADVDADDTNSIKSKRVRCLIILWCLHSGRDACSRESCLIWQSSSSPGVFWPCEAVWLCVCVLKRKLEAQERSERESGREWREIKTTTQRREYFEGVCVAAI